MDIKIINTYYIKMINEYSLLSLAGKITFPEVVKKLSEIGTERYIIDLVGLKKLYYGSNDQTYIGPFDFDAPKVAQKFNAEEIKKAITDSQQNKINYQTFLHRAIAAGCTHYEVFITGKKAIYFGRDGSQHIELFPSAK
jgi:uncharacterized protein YbcV (DUF1398 family)